MTRQTNINETKLKERIKELEKDRDLLQKQFLTVFDPHNGMVKPMMNNASIKQIIHANDLAIAELKRARLVIMSVSEEKDHPELVEFESVRENTLTKLLTELIHLREGILAIHDTETDTNEEWVTMAMKRLKELIK